MVLQPRGYHPGPALPVHSNTKRKASAGMPVAAAAAGLGRLSSDASAARALHAASFQNRTQSAVDLDDWETEDDGAEHPDEEGAGHGAKLRTIQSSLFTVWGNASMVDLQLRWRVQRCPASHEVRHSSSARQTSCIQPC